MYILWRGQGDVRVHARIRELHDVHSQLSYVELGQARQTHVTHHRINPAQINYLSTDDDILSFATTMLINHRTRITCYPITLVDHTFSFHPIIALHHSSQVWFFLIDHPSHPLQLSNRSVAKSTSTNTLLAWRWPYQSRTNYLSPNHGILSFATTILIHDPIP